MRHAVTLRLGDVGPAGDTARTTAMQNYGAPTRRGSVVLPKACSLATLAQRKLNKSWPTLGLPSRFAQVTERESLHIITFERGRPCS